MSQNYEWNVTVTGNLQGGWESLQFRGEAAIDDHYLGSELSKWFRAFHKGGETNTPLFQQTRLTGVRKNGCRDAF